MDDLSVLATVRGECFFLFLLPYFRAQVGGVCHESRAGAAGTFLTLSGRDRVALHVARHSSSSFGADQQRVASEGPLCAIGSNHRKPSGGWTESNCSTKEGEQGCGRRDWRVCRKPLENDWACGSWIAESEPPSSMTMPCRGLTRFSDPLTVSWSMNHHGGNIRLSGVISQFSVVIAGWIIIPERIFDHIRNAPDEVHWLGEFSKCKRQGKKAGGTVQVHGHTPSCTCSVHAPFNPNDQSLHDDIAATNLLLLNPFGRAILSNPPSCFPRFSDTRSLTASLVPRPSSLSLCLLPPPFSGSTVGTTCASCLIQRPSQFALTPLPGHATGGVIVACATGTGGPCPSRRSTVPSTERSTVLRTVSTSWTSLPCMPDTSTEDVASVYRVLCPEVVPRRRFRGIFAGRATEARGNQYQQAPPPHLLLCANPPLFGRIDPR